MVLRNFFLFIFSLFLFLPFAKAVELPNPDAIKVLKAEKGKHSKNYMPGTYLRIVYSTAQNEKLIIKGMLRGVNNDSVEIGSGKKNRVVSQIAIKDILSVQKLHKKGRMGWKINMSVLVALTIGGLIQINSMAALFYLAVPVVALWTYVPFLTGSFLADLISKKSVAKGWSFKAD